MLSRYRFRNTIILIIYFRLPEKRRVVSLRPFVCACVWLFVCLWPSITNAPILISFFVRKLIVLTWFLMIDRNPCSRLHVLRVFITTSRYFCINQYSFVKTDIMNTLWCTISITGLVFIAKLEGSSDRSVARCQPAPFDS